jgi:lipid-binding SYLF domain-containing protein
MHRRWALALAAGLMVVGGMVTMAPQPAGAATAAEIERDARAALERLYAENKAAVALRDQAEAILVFPEVIKGGLIVGGEYGEGALLKDGAVAGFYNIVSASIGLQAGGQAYANALFFMSPEALAYLDRSEGFEIGADAGVTLIDEGVGGELSSTMLAQPVIGFVWGQQGLMAGVKLEGSKITRIER